MRFREQQQSFLFLLAVCPLDVSTSIHGVLEKRRTKFCTQQIVNICHQIPLDQELIPSRYSSCCYSCWGNILHALQKSLSYCHFKADQGKFGRTVLQVNMHRLTKSDYHMTSFFQDGGQDVRAFAVAYAAASEGSPPSVCDIIGLLTVCTCTVPVCTCF